MKAGCRFGRWTLVEARRVPRANGGTRAAWLSRCDCGTERVLLADNFRTSRSCGCLRDELARDAHLTHGQGRSRTTGKASAEYTTWSTMRRRCHAAGSSGFRKYGARGITVCDRWRESFETFFADMGPKPSTRHSIGRIDNDGPYAPENCRWETPAQQGRNKRNTRWVTAFARTQTLSEWSCETGIDIRLLHKRLKRLPPEQALGAPQIGGTP